MTKIALVTGASGGIGRATALRFAQAGAAVMLADMNVDGGLETQRMITDGGGAAQFLKTDVSQEKDVATLVEQTVQRFGRLDWAFNNAGILGAFNSTDTYPVDVFDQVIAVNLRSVFLCMRYELEVMLAQGSGSIVNTASETCLKGGAGPLAYTASKHGVRGLTEYAALENATKGIRVNAVVPGSIQTPLVQSFIDAGAKTLQPNGRWGQASEIAEAVYWLCSDQSSNVIGHMLVVDGGWALT